MCVMSVLQDQSSCVGLLLNNGLLGEGLAERLEGPFALSFIHLAIHGLLGDPEDLEELAEVAAGLVAILVPCNNP